MKIATGIDIIEIDRIKQSIEESEGKFCDRVFTAKEIEYCESKKAQKYQHYAARFAAKEAIYKALSDFVPKNYKFTDFEVVNNEKGKPEVCLGFEISGLESIEISLSHCKEYAVAYVSAIIKE